jgi:hypothetical protein
MDSKKQDIVNLDEDGVNMTRRTSFTRDWKTTGYLVSPKGITRYS